MKRKSMLTLLVLLLLMGSLFASKSQARLHGVVNTRAYAISVEYGEKALVTENGVYDINKETPWNLLEDGKTDIFYLTVSGNEAKGQDFEVDIAPEAFKATINNEVYEGPEVKLIEEQKPITSITAGVHNDSTLAAFHFEWSGDTRLPSGDYTSDIKVTYSAS